MIPCRLTSIFPKLVTLFEHADIAKRRKALIVAITIAIQHAKLTEKYLVRVQKCIEMPSQDCLGLKRTLERLSGRYDEQYLREEEKSGMTIRALEYFSKARATAALAYAISDDLDQMLESMYEAVNAVDDPNVIIAKSLGALGSL